MLLNLAKVEILLKKHRFGSKEELREPIQIARRACELAKKIFGDKTLITNKTMLDCAVALMKSPSTKEEGKKVLAEAETLFTTINDEVACKEDCDLLFNLQLHF